METLSHPMSSNLGTIFSNRVPLVTTSHSMPNPFASPANSRKSLWIKGSPPPAKLNFPHPISLNSVMISLNFGVVNSGSLTYFLPKSVCLQHIEQLRLHFDVK